jgi:hypothetical protein
MGNRRLRGSAQRRLPQARIAPIGRGECIQTRTVTPVGGGSCAVAPWLHPRLINGGIPCIPAACSPSLRQKAHLPTEYRRDSIIQGMPLGDEYQAGLVDSWMVQHEAALGDYLEAAPPDDCRTSAICDTFRPTHVEVVWRLPWRCPVLLGTSAAFEAEPATLKKCCLAGKKWCPQRNSNPCRRLERPVS